MKTFIEKVVNKTDLSQSEMVEAFDRIHNDPDGLQGIRRIDNVIAELVKISGCAAPMRKA